MAFNLGSVGSFAGGLAGGIAQGQDIAMRQQQMKYQQDEQVARREERQRAKDMQAKLDAANAAGAAVLNSDRQDYQDRWQRAQPGPTMDGQPVQPAPMKPWVPDDYTRVKAAQAHADALLSNGLINEGAQAWAMAEGQRAKMRAGIANDLRVAITSGGDVTQALKRFDNLLDNGIELTKVEEVPGETGADGQKQPVLMLHRTNKVTGEELAPMPITRQQLLDQVDGILSDPQKAAEHAFQLKLQAFKDANDMERVKTRIEGEQGAEAAKHGYRLSEGATKFGYDTKLKSQEGGIQAGLQVSADALARRRPYTMGPDDTRVVDQPTPGPDGKPVLKPTVLLKTAPRPANAAGHDLNTMAINNFGTLDRGTGRMVGNPGTQKVAAAAERLIRDNPGLGANEALLQAAQDLGVQPNTPRGYPTATAPGQ